MVTDRRGAREHRIVQSLCQALMAEGGEFSAVELIARWQSKHPMASPDRVESFSESAFALERAVSEIKRHGRAERTRTQGD